MCPMLSPQEDLGEHIWKHLSLKTHFFQAHFNVPESLPHLFAMHSTSSACRRGSQILGTSVLYAWCLPAQLQGWVPGTISLATQADLTSVYWFLPACLQQGKSTADIPTGRETENGQAAVQVWAIVSRTSEHLLLITITPEPVNEGLIYSATIQAFSGKYQS